MAGEWIRMRVTLLRDPRVIRMADYLATEREFLNWLTDPVRRHCKETAYEHVTVPVMTSIVLGGLLQVWGIANDRGKVIDGTNGDLLLEHASLGTLDEMAGIPCFGQAMASVDWAREDCEGDAVIFPEFLQHNTPERSRAASNAERQRRHRQKKLSSQRNEDRNAERNARVTEARNARVTKPLLRSDQNREEAVSEDINGQSAVRSDVSSLPDCAPAPSAPRNGDTEPETVHVSAVLPALLADQKNLSAPENRQANGRLKKPLARSQEVASYAEILQARALQKMGYSGDDCRFVGEVALRVANGEIAESVLWDAVEGVRVKRPANKVGYFRRIVENRMRQA